VRVFSLYHKIDGAMSKREITGWKKKQERFWGGVSFLYKKPILTRAKPEELLL
jgi:hypothetical protein